MLATSASATAAPPKARPTTRPAKPSAGPTKDKRADDVADQAIALAAEKKKEGDQAMQEKRYAEALAAYDAAYAASPDPALLYNRARAEEHAEHFPEALALFEQFVEKAPPELRARVPKLDELMQSIRQRVAVLALEVDPDGSAVKLRGLSVGISPLSAPLRVPMGKATIEITREGYRPWSRELTLPGGKPTTVSATLVAVVPSVKPVALGAVAETKDTGPPPEPTNDKPITSRWWFWTGIGVGVAGGVALTAALLTERSAGKGTIAPGQVTAGLISF